nr:unnamed protein product [Digitaria exilis]
MRPAKRKKWLRKQGRPDSKAATTASKSVADHGNRHGMWEEVKVGDGHDVWLDGGLGDRYQTPAGDPDVRVLVAIGAGHLCFRS